MFQFFIALRYISDTLHIFLERSSNLKFSWYNPIKYSLFLPDVGQNGVGSHFVTHGSQSGCSTNNGGGAERENEKINKFSS